MPEHRSQISPWIIGTGVCIGVVGLIGFYVFLSWDQFLAVVTNLDAPDKLSAYAEYLNIPLSVFALGLVIVATALAYQQVTAARQQLKEAEGSVDALKDQLIALNKQIEQSEKGRKLGFVIEMYKEYSTPQMHQALRNIYGREPPTELEQHRRMVSDFLNMVALAVEDGLIQEKIIQARFGTGLFTLWDRLIPMEENERDKILESHLNADQRREEARRHVREDLPMGRWYHRWKNSLLNPKVSHEDVHRPVGSDSLEIKSDGFVRSNPPPLELQVAYWTKRLEQTLQHTQTSTRQIYLVDGAVLAFLYFLVRAVGTGRGIILFAAVPVFLLAVINYLHAQLIVRQHSWYNGIDAQLRGLLSQSAVEHKYSAEYPWQPKTSHDAHMWIHRAIMGALIVMVILMVLYGVGYFPEIEIPRQIGANLSTIMLPSLALAGLLGLC